MTSYEQLARVAQIVLFTRWPREAHGDRLSKGRGRIRVQRIQPWPAPRHLGNEKKSRASLMRRSLSSLQ